MAQGIKTLGVMPTDPVGWPVRKTDIDKSADVNGIDLGVADYWYVKAKISVKANGGTLTCALFASDAANGTGNIEYITPIVTVPTNGIGPIILEGVMNISQQYLNIDMTIGTSVTFDYEVFASPVSP